MAIPQTGIFTIGDAAHIYLELSASSGATAEQLVHAVVAFQEPRTTVSGANVVIGFRPELWKQAAVHDALDGLTSFNEPLPGSEGFSMPATQADLFLWIAGASYDVVFDLARERLNRAAFPNRPAVRFLGRSSKAATACPNAPGGFDREQ